MLAIVIPYYKFTFFEATLQSLANQTDKRFKVYISNDASPEGPELLLEKYEGQFDFVYHRFEHNLGSISLVQQWNRCIDFIHDEEWLMILGDDDELGEHCIADFYGNLAPIITAKSNVVRYATRINDVVQLKQSDLYTHPQLEKATDFFFRRISNQTRSSLSEYIFTRASFEKYGFVDYDLAWHSDDRAWLEFSENSPIYTINTSSVSFRLSGENISRGDYKIKEKQLVSFTFFKFVISNHFHKFRNNQQLYLLRYYEQLVYTNKKVTFSFWFTNFWLFLRSLNFMESIKFTRRLLIHLKKDE